MLVHDERAHDEHIIIIIKIVHKVQN